jgi:hypothetical protein
MNPPSRQQATEGLFKVVSEMRVMLKGMRAHIPAHMVFRPDFDSQERRCQQIEEFLRKDTNDDFVLAMDLFEDLMLHFQADSAASMAEIKGRMVTFCDELDVGIEAKKFELPAEKRNELEDLMQPYHDGIREEMVSELPIEMRREVDQARRKLGE